MKCPRCDGTEFEKERARTGDYLNLSQRCVLCGHRVTRKIFAPFRQPVQSCKKKKYTKIEAVSATNLRMRGRTQRRKGRPEMLTFYECPWCSRDPSKKVWHLTHKDQSAFERPST